MTFKYTFIAAVLSSLACKASSARLGIRTRPLPRPLPRPRPLPVPLGLPLPRLPVAPLLTFGGLSPKRESSDAPIVEDCNIHFDFV